MEESLLGCRFASASLVAGLLSLAMSACGAAPSPARAAAGSKLSSGVTEASGATPAPVAASAAPAPATSLNQLASPPAKAPSNTQPAAATPSASQGIKRTLLDQSDLRDLPGWQTRLYLIEYAPGVAAPRHHHPVAGVGYVLSGSFESTFEGGSTVEVHEGETFRDLPDVTHLTFKNTDTTKPLRFVISYVVRKDAPVLVVP